MQEAIKKAVDIFLKKSKNKKIKIISHHDTDGITSAAILATTLKRLDMGFSLKIIKQLEKEYIKTLDKDELLVFLDLGSSSLDELSKLPNQIFIIDHHEITGVPKENIIFINPHSFDEEEISASGLTYLFCKAANEENTDLANLAVIGMVGDMLDREISKINNKIIEDAELVIKRGLMLYPSTRPINRTLEFSSSLYIPGVTGNSRGVLNLLREADIKREDKRWKSLIELDDDELSKLITAILLRTKRQGEEVIGNIYLVKFLNRMEDARELSAMINACSRLGCSNLAVSFCLNDKKARKKVEDIYTRYKQHLVAALNYAETNKKEGKGYVILNAQENIKDTIIGTVASIISMSRQYEEGTVIVAMSYDKDKIKVSARLSGRNGRNVREILAGSIEEIGGEAGGHPKAAGCLIPKDKEKEFLDSLIKKLELEVVKV